MPIEEIQQVQTNSPKVMQPQAGIPELHQKKSKWWLWVLLIIVAIIIACGIYLWLA